MRPSVLLSVFASALFASAVGARAQDMYPGEDVIVNPVAGGAQVLLYPGGQYLRVVPPLRQPGETGGIVHLHMPRRTAAHAEKPSSARPTPRVSEVPTTRSESPTLPSTQASSAAGLFGSGPEATLVPAPNATRLAKIEPAPSRTAPQTGALGLVKRSVILFAPNAADPAQSALGAIKFLAGDLNAALTGINSRIQILAYGGARGDKSSNARRLSLKRALAIRQVLIDDGVPAERIDVSAMGGADDSGPLDRVDVYIRA